MIDKYYLRTFPDPILTKRCSEVEDFSTLGTLTNAMYNIMEKNNGAGIAAPQIGDDRRVIVAKINGAPKIFVNPKIDNALGYIPSLEGCLSFPGKIKFKFRSYAIFVDYQTMCGDNTKELFIGRNARLLQHEIDHLDGINIFKTE